MVLSLLAFLFYWVFNAGVKRLAKMGMVDSAPGMSALDMNTAEDMIVRNTREVVPGMIICGMEVSLTQSPCCEICHLCTVGARLPMQI